MVAGDLAVIDIDAEAAAARRRRPAERLLKPLAHRKYPAAGVTRRAPVGLKPTGQRKDDEDDQDDADDADASVTITISVAAKAPAESAKQE